MIASDPATRAAVDAFRDLLEDDPAGTRQELDWVRTQMVRSKLLFDQQPLPLCFAPAAITASRLEPIRRQVERLMRILIRLEDKLRHPRWMKALGIPFAEQELIKLPTRLRQGRLISRVDGFLAPPAEGDTGYRVVELNVDSPGGGGFMDACASLLRRTPTWNRFRERFPGRYLPTDRRTLLLLLRCWRDWGGTELPRIAIVDWITVNTVQEFDILKSRFRARGVEAVICDPRELEFKAGRLRDYDGKPIDLVYRRVLVEDLLEHGEEALPLLSAYRAGAVCVVNSFASKPLTVKSLLSLFHRDEAEELLTHDELRLVRRLVPWTADVEDGPVLEQIRSERESLVLKPADSYGAEGLYLGWRTEPAEWDRAIAEALKGRYVVQRRVTIPEGTFPVPVEGGWEHRSFRMDFDPYMFGRGMADPLVRLSGSEVLNVKQGGSIAVTWILDQ